jgi:hypothetical protein
MTGGSSGGLDRAEGRGDCGRVEADSCSESSQLEGVGRVGAGAGLALQVKVTNDGPELCR